jgi:hypothetical protein
MTIEQMVEISANRRIFLDLPPDLPSGKVKVEVRVAEISPSGKTDTPLLSLMDLYGSCEGEDTLDAYFKRKQADKAPDGITGVAYIKAAIRSCSISPIIFTGVL